MANKLRFLNIPDIETHKVLNSIATQQKRHITSLPATSAIPNQSFATEQNKFGKPATIHFTQGANTYLQFLRDLDHHISSINMSKGKQSQPLKFSCFGYKDLDGDIVITSIECPVYEEARQQGFKNQAQLIDYIIKNMTTKDMSIENSARVFDYLRQYDFVQPKPIGTDIVALMGTTKHANLDNDDYNCFTVSELSEAVIPYYVPIKANNVISGTIAITPKTISEKYLLSRGKGDNIANYLQDGSIEVALISYTKSESTGYVNPQRITNVTQALAETKQGLVPLKISSSSQPTGKIYKAKDKDDYTM